MTKPSRDATVLVLNLLFALAAALPAHSEVPTAADVAACNSDATQAIKTGGASPTSGDHARADRARGGVMTKSVSATGTAIESPDPQIHGMEGEGAKSPVYQAAYRSCMRRKGF